MCGICGVYDPTEWPSLDLVAAMAAREAHRGPDDAGVWAAGPVALGHRRLAIIDLSAEGHQPMLRAGRLSLTYCGEIYNFRELRRELEALGHRFRSQSDTEVLLAGYQQWGVDVATRLNGIFAFAVWDGERGRLYCARDRLGVKPLYFRHDRGRFAFASEAKALLVGELGTPGLDEAGLANYLAFGHAVGTRTIWRGVHKLAPGHWLTVGPEGLEERCYWDVVFRPDPAMSEAEAVRGVRERLELAVRRQMVADVPVGAFLSGGVDSSAIVALMARQTSERIKTYAVGFTDRGAFNELPEAARVARHIGTDHHEVELRAADLPGLLERLVWHYDEPFADAAAFPLLVVAEAARRDVAVVLTGEGGDELFGGYRRFAFERLSPAYQRVPRSLRRGLEGAVARLPGLRRPKQALRAMGAPDPAERLGEWLVVFDGPARDRLLRPELQLGRYADPLADYRRHYDPDRDVISNALYVDLKTWLPDAYLEKVDKATMAVGLEARVPILDHELVEYAATIPSDLKVHGREMKYVLKRAVADLVPAHTLTRPKHGFAVPTDPWFRGELAGQARELLLGPDARLSALVRPEEVGRLLDEHRSGRNSHNTRLWTLLNLEMWLRTPLAAGAEARVG